MAKPKRQKAPESLEKKLAQLRELRESASHHLHYRRDIGGSPTPEQRRRRLMDDYRARFASPYSVSDRGYIDDVIAPHETPPKVIAALEALQTKRVSTPKRKHGNIPL